MQPHDQQFLSRALELAEQGRGHVEPNPLVGAVIVREEQVVGEGWHQQFGGPHAEIVALQNVKDGSRGAELYVSLEPCCHEGKTPPCTEALINAGIARVIVGCEDPNPQVAGQGIARLREAGIQVDVYEDEHARRMIAPFRKFTTTGHPWVIAKWAMTLDGKIASHTGSSQWITTEASRALVHQIRGQVDAILVGRVTVERDNPLLTARPPGPRVATRIVLDSEASLSLDSQLVTTARDVPVMVVARDNALTERIEKLHSLGVEVFLLPPVPWQEQMLLLLDELGKRDMTNLLVEGGSQVFGAFADVGAIDEVHAFIAPKLAGGKDAPSPIGGTGVVDMSAVIPVCDMQVETLDGDLHVHGYVAR
jgi:diaminohydroxyphosphoribosylaminopyrimidine deaminase / 5-amino-6-(5-phosphoribosylamino)uracil reductase